jgi:hypothetical protein
MSALAAESPTDFRAEPRGDDVEPWEIHSELVLVSPEVCRRALEELPERDPDAFLTRSPSSPEAPANGRRAGPAFLVAVFGYALWQLGQRARFGLLIVGGLIVLATLAELLR